MNPFSTRHVILSCSRCGSALGAADHRTYPPRLDVTNPDGSPASSERAGRVLQRVDEGTARLSDPDGDRRDWLADNALEIVYRFRCPEDDLVWALSGDIGRAIRRADRDRRWVTIPVT
ncbi:hypothetical protein ACQP1U_15985 [Actinomycetota bacterium]